MTEPDDKLLEDYLRGDSALSRDYARHAGDMPPRPLDAAIFARAKQALEHDSRQKQRRSMRRWSLSFALAASVVLSLVLVQQLVLLPQMRQHSPPRPARLLEAPPANIPDSIAPGGDTAAMDRVERDDARPASADSATPAQAPAHEPAPIDPVVEKSEEAVRQERVEITGSRIKRQDFDGAPPAAEVWLAEILALHEAGEQEAARHGLKQFRRFYPEYPVPEALAVYDSGN